MGVNVKTKNGQELQGLAGIMYKENAQFQADVDAATSATGPAQSMTPEKEKDELRRGLRGRKALLSSAGDLGHSSRLGS
jgi:hypothetical protein